MDTLVESFPKHAINGFTQGDPYRVKPDTDL